MRKLTLASVLALGTLLLGGAAYADDVTGDSARGEDLFKHHCGACHSLTANRVGPILSGVYGRKAGTVTGFTYSQAVQASAITWNSTTLDQWLSGPQKFIPGQRMNFNISDPQKRADIIAYLKTASEPEKK
jgi:cytochrome c